MKRFTFIISALLIMQFFAVSTAFSSNQNQVKRTINIVMKSIKYKRDSRATRYIDFTQMGKNLMGSYWYKMTPAQKKEMTRSIKHLIVKKTFSAGREMFGYFDYITVIKSRFRGNKAKVKVLIVVNRLRKRYKIDFGLKKSGGQWKIVEIYMLGEGIIETVRDDEVKPLIRKGGIPAVMKALRREVRNYK